METQIEIIEILTRTGAIITNSHIVGTSGRHMSTYLNKDAVYPHTTEAGRIGELFAEQNKHLDIDVVVGPALGGIILSQWTAHHLSRIKGIEILGIYTEKTPENDQVFKRGYDKLVNGKKVLIVEDLTTTGESAKKVSESVKAAGGEVLMISVIANRDPKRVTTEFMGVPFSWLSVVLADSYEASECPHCQSNVPINTTVGHGKKFLEEHSLKSNA